MRPWLMVVVIFGIVGASSGEEQPSARTLLRAAYLSVAKAELAQIAGQRTDALSGYRDALQIFDQLYTQYPGWQGELVSFRSADCQNRIRQLEAAPDAAPVATNEVPLRAAALTSELEQLQAILGAPSAAPVAAELPEAVPGTSGEQTKTLQAERDALRTENQGLLKTQAKLEARLAKLEKKAGLPPAGGTVPLCASVIKVEARRLLKDKEQDVAVRLLEEAVGLMPDDEELVTSLATAYCHAGRFADAVTTLRGVVRRAPDSASAWILLGTADMGLGQRGDARIAMEEALKRDPNSADAHYNLAQILMALTPPNASEARMHYDRALSLGSQPDPHLEQAIRDTMIIKKLERRR